MTPPHPSRSFNFVYNIRPSSTCPTSASLDATRLPSPPRVTHPPESSASTYKHNHQTTNSGESKPIDDVRSNMASDGSEEFRLVSPTISNEGKIPRHYTDEGQGAKRNVSPPLEWYNLPEGTKTLALVVEDIDAPDTEGPIVPWVHWVVVNIPPTVKGLPEGFSGKEEEAGGDYAGIKEGNNDWKIPGWRGPRLPNHGHRFEFRLYALNEELHLGNKVTKDKVMEAIEGHVLGEATLVAKF